MTGELEFFRKRFVGGFNREDVVKYITKLSKERNEWQAAKEEADQNAKALSDEIARLRLELDAARREASEGFAYKATVLENAAGTFAKLENAFGSLRSDLGTTVESICVEFDQARKTMTSIPALFEQADKNLKELHASCESERKAAVDAMNSITK